MTSYEFPPNDFGENSDNLLSPTNVFQPNTLHSNEEPITIGYATAVYDFEARYEDELSVSVGDYVQVIQAYDEWIMARNPMTPMSGLIPMSYLQVFLDNAISNENVQLQYDEAPTETISSVYDTQQDSGTSSLSSSNTNDVQSNQPDSLDDFIELFGLKPKQQGPPPRPPLPKTTNNRSIQPIRAAPVQSSVSNNGDVPEWHRKFGSIVSELLNSEIQYSTELRVWEKCVNQSTQLNEQQKCILTNGYPMLQDLSQILIRSLSEQLDKKVEHQSYGQMFMGLRDRITRTYAYYFRCIIEITQVIENREDKVTHDALQGCLKQMRDSGVFVFDVTTAIVRPINRCLKYPLFIAELLKLLPLTHIDHPKLLEANKQMKTLVTKMNESKRRKELVKKSCQNNQQEASIVNKFSKLNMKSIRKKSKRLVSSIGLAGHPKQI